MQSINRQQGHWQGPSYQLLTQQPQSSAPYFEATLGEDDSDGHPDTRHQGPIFDDTVLFVRWNRMRRLGGHYLTKEPWLIPPQFRPTQPRYSIPARHLHSAQNKIKHPVNVVRWTPDGHRLLTGSASGEFTLWDGKAFNFVTIMSAHDSAVRAVDWSGSNEWMLSADQDGIVKYWNPQFNNVKQFQAHRDFPVRDIAFAPTDSKFVTASDDSTLKVWDFASATEHSELKGHGWDVKTCDWHPERGLVVSGSKDHTVKLWDPRSGNCLTTLHGHKPPITRVRFGGRNGMCLATSARDSTARIFDLKMMRDMLLLRGNEKDTITTITWHPHHPSMVSTGSNDGAITHYILTHPNPPTGQSFGRSPYDTNDPATAPMQNIWPAHTTKYAHDMAIWSMDWHPKGLVLASGSNDRATRFWVRSMPSNSSWENDHWHKGPNAAPAWRSAGHPSSNRRGAAIADEDDADEDEADALVDQKMPARPSMPGLGLPGLSSPGLPGLSADGSSTGGAQTHPSLAMKGFPPPPPGFVPGMSMEAKAGQPPFPMFGGNGMIPPDPRMFPGGIPPPLPGFQFPPGFEPPPGLLQARRGSPGDLETSSTGIRRRAPLPSQEDSYRRGGL